MYKKIALVSLLVPSLGQANVTCSDYNANGIDERVQAVYNKLPSTVLSLRGGLDVSEDCFFLRETVSLLSDLARYKKHWKSEDFNVGQFRTKYEYSLTAYCVHQASEFKPMYHNVKAARELGRELSRFLSNEMDAPFDCPGGF